jgi:hypothetical protein
VAELWRDIKERGYPGPIQQVHRWVNRRREVDRVRKFLQKDLSR